MNVAGRSGAGDTAATDDGSRIRHVSCLAGGQLHRVAYREWGDPANPRAVVCAHALTRNSRDFGPLARALSSRWRVVAPDMPGRGASDRLRDPMLYQVPTYVADAVTLIARLDVEELCWVGISLGGLMGMGLAAMDRTPIRRLVISDAGPVIARAALERIAGYVGVSSVFPTRAAAFATIRAVSEPFGPHDAAQWNFLVDNVLVRRDDGSYALHYDPAIGVPFRAALAAPGDVDLWGTWDAIRAPTLVLRGGDSDLLGAATAAEMTRRGPRADLVTLPGVGHAPTLVPDAQIEIVRAFLERP
ncbi:2-(acetamidomethylene)succinate hydrolase [Burkholderiales bacterium]|nr:2-(acetamidomethylene)succinate hydrolase [Burkholderiales bacterium]